MATGSLTASQVESLLRAELASQGALSLQLEAGEGAVFEDEGGTILARLTLCIREADGSIVDMKQQELWLVQPEHRADPERTSAFLRGWARSVPAIVTAHDRDPFTLLPCDLYLPMPLRDAPLRTDEDFARLFGDVPRLRALIREAERGGVAEELARWGLAQEVDAFEALRRPAIHFGEPRFVEPDEAGPIGATRFGSEPDLPPDVAWPTHEGVPMTFAGQLDLEGLARFAAARELPRTGLLAFFYHPFGERSLPARVIHVPSRDGLSRRATPEGGDRRPALIAVPYELAATLPPIESPFYEALLPDETIATFRQSIAAAARGAGPVIDPLDGLAQYVAHATAYDHASEEHRLLGYCQPHQGDVYVETERHASGLGGGLADASADEIRTLRAARRWRLLLQVWAFIDGQLLLEQDAGAVYFMIPDEALAAHDWSRVRCELQCS